MVVEIFGVVNEFPVPRAVPPDADAYQLTVPADGVALNVTVPELQTLPGVELTILGAAFTVMAVVAVAEHPSALVYVYVTVVFPAPAVAGLNVPPETPVPE